MKSDYWKWISAAAMVAVTATSISGCATPDSSTPDGAPRPDLTVGAVDLSEVCPATITVQTDWNPQAEQGGLFELLGDNPVIDRTTASITGPLMTRGEYTGVDLQIRAGGPAIGQQAVSAQMYTDPTITLGYVNTDEAIRLAASMPTTAVFAPLEISPQIIMWDPRTWPDVHTIADLGQTGATVRYFGGATYMDYLVSAGLLDRQQIDGGYDGTPGNWVAAAGKDAQQGFVGVEPYVYEHELDTWTKPVRYQLIHDTGYAIYQNALSVRTDELDGLAPCLKQLIPIMQRGSVDYLNSPDRANALILHAVDTFDNGWIYSSGVANHSHQMMSRLGLVGNGNNATLGDLDLDRIQHILDITTPIFSAHGNPVPAELAAAGLATNDYIDPTIGTGNP
jgi:hypothetical protein